MCACANKRENFWEKWSNKGETWDLFDFWKTCCAQDFESALFWESCTCERERLGRGSFLFCLAPGFPSASGMTVSSLASVFEESYFGFWSIASSHCPCLRESICAWVSDYSWLSELFCHLLEFFAFLFLFLSLLCFQVVCWQCTHQGGDWGTRVLYPACDEWIVNRAVWSRAWSLDCRYTGV